MKLNYKRTVLIGLAFLSICAFWQMYDSIIPLILQNTFGIGETLTGAIMAADNVLAIFLLPLFGALSDKADTRFGKRMPFIVTGTVLAVIFLLLLPIADRKVNMVLFIVSLFALLVSMGLYRSPAVALMPDLTPNKLRSKGNAIINLMGAVGGVYTLIMIKLLVGKGERPDYMPLFVSVAALMAVSVGILAITISEKKVKAKVAQEVREYEDRTGLKVETEDTVEAEEAAAEGKESVKHQMPAEVKRSMGFLLASIFLWFTAYNAVTTAFSRYTKVVWHLEGGGFADCLMGIGWAAINVNSYPMIVEMSKGSDIGKFTGTYYTFSMAAQILTPVLSGFLLEKVSYRTLFPYAFVFSVLAFITMMQVHHGDTRPDKKASVLEHFDVDD